MHGRLNDAMKLATARFGLGNTLATAGGAGNNTQVSAAFVGRLNYFSAKVIIPWTAVLSASQTLRFSADFRESAVSAGTSPLVIPVAPANVTAATGAGTFTGVTEYDLDLAGVNAFFQARITPILSAAATDTVNFSIAYILSGSLNNPVSPSNI